MNRMEYLREQRQRFLSGQKVDKTHDSYAGMNSNNCESSAIYNLGTVNSNKNPINS